MQQPWPWYVSGPLISLVMFLLLWAGGNFGVSSNLRTICSIGGAGKKIDFFNIDWKSQLWNLTFIVGAIIGGFLATSLLSNPEPVKIASATVQDLASIGIAFDGELAPASLFSWESLASIRGFIVLIVGGFMVGFGARWAGGCTSGHAISGLSNFQLASFIAVVGFFIGGLFMTHLVFPIIF